MDLTDRVALVTGAARRLGREIARTLAHAGASIAIHHNSSPERAEEARAEFEAGGSDAAVFRADLTQEDEIAALFEDVEGRFGRLDILINNAAIFEHSPVLEIAAAEWDRTLDLNLRAPFLCSQRAARLMRRDRGGHIINLADAGAFQPWPGYAHYCISKAGVLMLTRVLARALAPDILVNAVAPGPVLPPDDLDAGEREELARRTALRRLGSPDDVTSCVRFLLESNYITGETIVVDGGKLLMTR